VEAGPRVCKIEEATVPTTEFRTIMVALDGSSFAEAALAAARELARRAAARLHLVSVRERGPGWASDLWPTPEMDRWREEYLAKVAEAMAAEGDVEVTTALPVGDQVPDALLAEAGDAGADLLVLSSHGRGRLSRSWLGNVAASVLHHAELPLLVVRPEEEAGADEAGAGGEAPGTAPAPWGPVDRVLVALDGTPASEAAVEPALGLARLLDARLHLVRVAPFPRAYTSPYIPHAVQINQDVVNEEEEKARSYLDEARTRLVPEGVEVDAEVVVTSQPARGILAEAAEAGAGLVALATHHGALRRFALGSTADKVVRASDRPVLLVRSPEE
jgi:nucleotide-binding universal stress UspA family protein